MIAISLLTSVLMGADLWQVAHWQTCVGTSNCNKKAAPCYRKPSSSLSWWNLPNKNPGLKPKAYLRFCFCAVAHCHIPVLASQIIDIFLNIISQTSPGEHRLFPVCDILAEISQVTQIFYDMSGYVWEGQKRKEAILRVLFGTFLPHCENGGSLFPLSLLEYR